MLPPAPGAEIDGDWTEIFTTLAADPMFPSVAVKVIVADFISPLPSPTPMLPPILAPAVRVASPWAVIASLTSMSAPAAVERLTLFADKPPAPTVIVPGVVPVDVDMPMSAVVEPITEMSPV